MTIDFFFMLIYDPYHLLSLSIYNENYQKKYLNFAICVVKWAPE